MGKSNVFESLRGVCGYEAEPGSILFDVKKTCRVFVLSDVAIVARFVLTATFLNPSFGEVKVNILTT